MNLLIYAGRGNLASRRLLKSVDRQMNPQLWRHIDDIEGLVDELHNPMGLCPIAILFPANREELARLVSLRHLLRDTQIILILPNAQAQTISDGHTLRPRFISYADSDFSDVTAVCAKMMEHYSSHALVVHQNQAAH